MMRRMSKGVERDGRHLYDRSARVRRRIDIAPMMMVKYTSKLENLKKFLGWFHGYQISCSVNYLMVPQLGVVHLIEINSKGTTIFLQIINKLIKIQ